MAGVPIKVEAMGTVVSQEMVERDTTGGAKSVEMIQEEVIAEQAPGKEEHIQVD